MDELKRLFKRDIRINRIGLIIALLILAFNIYDRRVKVEEIKEVTRLSRSMLNARGRIQIILLNANLEGRRLNAAEIDQIKALWSKAEYDQADAETK